MWKTPFRKALFLFAVLFCVATPLAQVLQGSITYTLHREANPTADQVDAYSRITAAMDSATKLYNTHTSVARHLNVHYNTSVSTADANYNGTLRFGASRSYMVVGTAMHEISHALGVGTTTEYRNRIVNGVFTGPQATAQLRTISGDPNAVLRGDTQHFWPHGINFASEVRSEQDLIDHCLMVEAILQDIFQERLYFSGRIRAHGSGQCMVRTGQALQMGDCADPGTQVRIIAMGEVNPVFRMHFGDRVLDTPNESTSPAVVMGLYGWNGGAHQRVILEEQGGAAAGTYRVRMVHSNHYLRNAGTQVLQDRAATEPATQLWELIPLQEAPVTLRYGGAKSSRVLRNPHNTELRNSPRFDLQGRRRN